MFGAFLPGEWVFLIDKEQELKFRGLRGACWQYLRKCDFSALIKVAKLSLVLSSEGFHLMCHPGGTTCLYRAQAKLEHSNLNGNVNYLGFFRKHTRVTLGILPFCTLSKARWKGEKKGKFQWKLLTLLYVVCFRSLLNFWGL